VVELINATGWPHGDPLELRHPNSLAERATVGSTYLEHDSNEETPAETAFVAPGHHFRAP